MLSLKRVRLNSLRIHSLTPNRWLEPKYKLIEDILKVQSFDINFHCKLKLFDVYAYP